jgi:hypothetical protein
MQERSFEFDKEFKDFSVDNPLLRQHKEWDEEAMTGANGSPQLTPEHYNRCVGARRQAAAPASYCLPVLRFLPPPPALPCRTPLPC